MMQLLNGWTRIKYADDEVIAIKRGPHEIVALPIYKQTRPGSKKFTRKTWEVKIYLNGQKKGLQRATSRVQAKRVLVATAQRIDRMDARGHNWRTD